MSYSFPEPATTPQGGASGPGDSLMLLRGKCPGCGDAKEYIAELVGSETDCMKCGRRFVLKDNPGRVTWHIFTATLAVLILIGGIGARVYLRSNRWQRA